MKKILSIFIILSVFLSLTSCGYEVKIVRKDYDPDFECTMEWAEKYFGSLINPEEFSEYAIAPANLRYTGRIDYPSGWRPEDSFKVNGRDFPMPPDAESVKISMLDFSYDEYYPDSNGNPSYTTGYLRNKRGGGITVSLKTTGKSADMTIEDFKVPTVTFYSYDINGEKVKGRIKFEVNGLIDSDSTLEEIVKKLGTPYRLNVEKNDGYFEVYIDYDRKDFSLIVNEKGSYIYSMRYYTTDYS